MDFVQAAEAGATCGAHRFSGIFGGLFAGVQ